MRKLVLLLWLGTTLGSRAAVDWRGALAGMPLTESVRVLDSSNYARVLLGAFASNDTVKALIIMPGAVDTFFWNRDTRVTLGNGAATLLEAVEALTNQTRIRATFDGPFLLLRYESDPEHPLCEVRSGAGVEKLRARKFVPHAVYRDVDWDGTWRDLKKGTAMTIVPQKQSRYSYHFYRSTFAAWNLTAWEGVEVTALATRTIVSVERGRLSFREDSRDLVGP